ncbi:S-methyl-5'-thioadenosine phosphorylase [Alicyclobacillus tolerans]|uniref:S-methyl-5'-thioadenosine phosphorylase n=1 Tax=Alicyclobacillus tolerans TaxID=90970 RepID=UPI001F021B2B|nr:S-methyl-5'-thioadenosine phosphorylase [Alicyclobacillus tolerans]MCF8563791.1 S-methyl-5'-thioadenosine phosphorylase [Alicyclobacillus tolerans]
MHADFAIIGGTGVYDPKLLDDTTPTTIETAFGEVQATVGTYQGKHIVFMPRHGFGHSTPPHKINYRANILALKQLGVTQVLATAAVGSLRRELRPGSLVIVDSFLDFTKNRPVTFFEDNAGVVHVDMSDPYCHRLRQSLASSAEQIGISVHHGGTYVCTEGPRFESSAEIRMFQAMGGSVVGMTSVPEVVLAKEAEMCYATVCMVTNFGAGMTSSALTHEEVLEEMDKNVSRIRELFFHTLSHLTSERSCRCKEAVGGQSPLVGVQGGERH